MATSIVQPVNTTAPWKSRTRLRNDRFIGAGPSVRVTNPKAGPTATARRTRSLGMGGIDQYNKL